MAKYVRTMAGVLAVDGTRRPVQLPASALCPPIPGPLDAVRDMARVLALPARPEHGPDDQRGGFAGAPRR